MAAVFFDAIAVYTLAIMYISHPQTTTETSDRSLLQQRIRIESLVNANQTPANEPATGYDIIESLATPYQPKTLSPKYFYDDQGSLLFEKICELPEYYPTRTETAILRDFASEIATLTGPTELVELGSGSSTKTRILLDAYQSLGYPLRYLPIDISGGILENSAYQLLEDYPSLQVHGIVATYEQALAKLEPAPLPSRMICFLGSTLGNLTPTECDRFFAQITAALLPGEYFLLGVDLHKPTDILEAAYNDSQGVTAAFNLNMLSHLNHRFDGDFDIKNFEHWAFYNLEEHQIEMHLRSICQQTVHLRSLNLTVNFSTQETVRTEISRKFELENMQNYLNQQGLQPVKTWTDSNNWFGLILAKLT